MDPNVQPRSIQNDPNVYPSSIQNAGGYAMPVPPPHPHYPYSQPYPGYPPPMVTQPMSSQMSSNNTTVVITGPQAPAVRQLRDWNTGLFGCFEDCGGCLCVTFCPECAARTLMSDVNESQCVPYCVNNWVTVTRTKIRLQLDIRGSILHDSHVAYCCPQCAMCQMMREVKLAKQNGHVFY